MRFSTTRSARKFSLALDALPNRAYYNFVYAEEESFEKFKPSSFLQFVDVFWEHKI
jgi:hypothetical protein